MELEAENQIKLTFEERLYKSVGFKPYKAYKIEFNKTINKPEEYIFNIIMDAYYIH